MGPHPMRSARARALAAQVAVVPLALALVAVLVGPSLARGPRDEPNRSAPKFAQLGAELPTPDDTRLASGAPGPAYWQQKVDYRITVRLDDARQRIEGEAEITYHNRSPHALEHLWLQVDQNRFKADSASRATEPAPADLSKFSHRQFGRELAFEQFKGGVDLGAVTLDGKPLPHTVVDTMLRLDLPTPLAPGRSLKFKLAWAHNIVDARVIGGRGGYETLDDGTRLYTIAQWHPRLCTYSADQGWQNKAFLGNGEFSLEFGDFDVSITVPGDHVVGATGVLKNAGEVLSGTQRSRLDEAARSFDKPVLVVTGDEAARTRDNKAAASGTRTWHFVAENVRDFAFATSKAFWWDAMAVKLGEGKTARTALAMSFYPKEAAPLWTRYSTHAVAHTLEVYSKFTVDYPYPVAISVNGPVGGMEYPMISFNGPRAEDDGTYYDRPGEGKSWHKSKYGLISVVIHEVGHNWFPMIINSDERQWTWLDEGLNSFVQFLAEQEWEQNYPSWRGHPDSIVPYMLDLNQVPIMTNSESLQQFGNNAYGKPAVALNILRETVLGRTLFDHAFKAYARRWAFKRPTPADFFRSLEDDSGVDLDWFWRGWFYGTGHVDQGVDKVTVWRMETGDPDHDKPLRRKERDDLRAVSLTRQRNAELPQRVDRFPDLKDFYNARDTLDVTPAEREAHTEALGKLEPHEKAVLGELRTFTVIDFASHGPVPMPIVARITLEDGSQTLNRWPAEVWVKDDRVFSKLLVTRSPVKRVELDPFHEVADADRANNDWQGEPVRKRFALFKRETKPNAMQAEEKARKAAAEKASKAAAEKKAAGDKPGTEKPGTQKPGAEKPGTPAVNALPDETAPAVRALPATAPSQPASAAPSAAPSDAP